MDAVQGVDEVDVLEGPTLQDELTADGIGEQLLVLDIVGKINGESKSTEFQHRRTSLTPLACLQRW